jgi:hypothetical protein
MTISVTGIFQRSSKYEGVRPIHIYLLRLLYVLMFFVLGRETWTQILTHQGPWDPFKAVAGELLFTKTPQAANLDSCNNVTGFSACSSFQTHFGFWREIA